MQPSRHCSLRAFWRATKARPCGASRAGICSHRLSQSVGLHPDRVIYAETRRESEVLAAAEEGLRHKGLAGVVAEVARLGLTASRAFSLRPRSRACRRSSCGDGATIQSALAPPTRRPP